MSQILKPKCPKCKSVRLTSYNCAGGKWTQCEKCGSRFPWKFWRNIT